MKIIWTGATGEGVLLTCLDHPAIARVLVAGRRPSGIQHKRLKELIVPDFFSLGDHIGSPQGYDACFYCAGISSAGRKESEYSRITYDTTVHFAHTLAALNPAMVFNFVSGSHTDSSEQGKVM